MVTAPRRVVFVEEVRGSAAQRCLPGNAVVQVVRRPQVRDEIGVEIAVHLVSPIDAVHGFFPGLGVGERFQLLFDLGADPVVLGARGDDPVPLASQHVDIDAAEAQGVRLRPVPVHVLEELAGNEEILQRLLLSRAPQDHESVAHQPRVDVERASPGRKAVIGADEEHAVGRERRAGLAHRRVHALVALTYEVAPDARLVGVVGRVFRVEEAPEHVSVPIGVVIDLHIQAVPGIADEGVHHRLELRHEEVPILGVLLFGGHALVERPGVHGPAERLPEADLLEDLLGEPLGVGDGKDRIERVEVDRLHVELEPGAELEEAEAGDPLHPDHAADRELQPDEVAPLSFLQAQFLPGDLDIDALVSPVQPELHRQLDLGRRVEELVERAVDERVDRGVPLFHVEEDDLAAHLRVTRGGGPVLVAGVGGVDGVGAEGPADVRDAEAGKKAPPGVHVRRKRVGNPDDRRADAVLRQNLPEGRPLAVVHHGRLFHRDVGPDERARAEEGRGSQNQAGKKADPGAP